MMRSWLGPVTGTLMLFLAASWAGSSARPAEVHELAWLSGRWVMEKDGQYVEETWSPAVNDALVGCLRWACKGEVWLYELMSIEAEEGSLVLRLRQPLLGGPREPACRRRRVAAHAPRFEIGQAQPQLGVGDVRSGRLLEPSHRRGVVAPFAR